MKYQPCQDRFLSSQCICNLIKSFWWLRKSHASIFQIGFYVIKNKFKSNRDFGVLLRIPMSGVGRPQLCVGVCVRTNTVWAFKASFEKFFPGRRVKGTVLEHSLPYPALLQRKRKGGGGCGGEGKHKECPQFKYWRNGLAGFVILGYLLTGIICFCVALHRKRKRKRKGNEESYRKKICIFLNCSDSLIQAWLPQLPRGSDHVFLFTEEINQTKA